jgi:hypothetical protein
MKTLRDVRELLRQESFGVDYIMAIDAAIAREEQTAGSFEEWQQRALLYDMNTREYAYAAGYGAGRASRDAEVATVDLDQPCTPQVAAARIEHAKAELQKLTGEKPSHTCKLCGKPRREWQVYCGAACCARWERGERPKDVQKERSAGPKGASEEDTGHTSQHLARQMGSHEPGTTSDKPRETGVHVSRYYCSICGETYLSPAKVQHACWVPRDKPGEIGAYRGVPADVVIAAGREAVDLNLDKDRCPLCCPDHMCHIPHAIGCPLRDVGQEVEKT